MATSTETSRQGRAITEPAGASYTAVAVQWDGGFDVFVVHVTRGLVGRTRAGSFLEVERAARRYLQAQGQAARGVQIRVVAG